MYWSLIWDKEDSLSCSSTDILNKSETGKLLIISSVKTVFASTSLTFLLIFVPFNIDDNLCFILLSKISSSTFLSSWTLSISARSIVIDLSSLSIPCLLNTLTSTTIPPLPLGIFNDVSVTSIAFSPNIDLNSFSSGPDAVSPLGVTLPTKISPGLTSAPI